MTLRHRNYEGTVVEEDGRLIVRIVDIPDMISAETFDAAAAPEIFRDLVEDYIATCAEIGKEPVKPKVT